jgi:hypothetical protein
LDARYCQTVIVEYTGRFFRDGNAVTSAGRTAQKGVHLPH